MFQQTVDNLQIQWIEEQDHIFPFVIVQGDIFELSVNHSGALEERSFFLQLGDWHFRLKD